MVFSKDPDGMVTIIGFETFEFDGDLKETHIDRENNDIKSEYTKIMKRHINNNLVEYKSKGLISACKLLIDNLTDYNNDTEMSDKYGFNLKDEIILFCKKNIYYQKEYIKDIIEDNNYKSDVLEIIETYKKYSNNDPIIEYNNRFIKLKNLITELEHKKKYYNAIISLYNCDKMSRYSEWIDENQSRNIMTLFNATQERNNNDIDGELELLNENLNLLRLKYGFKNIDINYSIDNNIKNNIEKFII